MRHILVLFARCEGKKKKEKVAPHLNNWAQCGLGDH